MRKELAALVAVFFLLVALTGSVGYYFISKGNAEYRALIADRLALLAVAEDMGQLNRRREENLLQIVAVADKGSLASAMQALDGDFAARVARLEAANLTADERAMLEGVKAAARKFAALQVRMVVLARAGRTEEAITLYQAHDRVPEEVAENIRALMKVQQRESTVLLQESRAVYHRNMQLLASAVVALIICAVLAGLYVRGGRPEK